MISILKFLKKMISRTLSGYVISALLILIGFDPTGWIEDNIFAPSYWLNHWLFRSGLIVAGFFVLGGTFWSARRSLSQDILLLPPRNRYSLTWDPPHDLQIITRPEFAFGTEVTLETRLPVFLIKNVGTYTARDVRIEWTAEDVRMNTLAERSSRLTRIGAITHAGGFRVVATHNFGRHSAFAHCHDRSGAHTLPYLAPTIDNHSVVETPMPSEVYAYAETYFVAALPSDPPFQAVALSFSAAISWVSPSGRGSTRYRVYATARSTRPWSQGDVRIPLDDKMRTPPEVMASIVFTVEHTAGRRTL